MAAPPKAPPQPATSPWLHVAAPVGKVACAFLLAANFANLFAPLFFLVDTTTFVNPNGDPGGSLILLLSDPGRLLALGDLLSIIGVVILSSAFLLILFGLVRGDKRVPLDAWMWGFFALVCLIAWVPVMLVAQGIARGTVSNLDAAAATGGWSLAAGLLLGATILFLLFTLRVEKLAPALRLTTLKWPIYAAANVLGSAALAAFFSGAATGAGNEDAFTLGLTMKVTLIPMLGILAYRDLFDRFPLWEHVPLMNVQRPLRTVLTVPTLTPMVVGTLAAKPAAIPPPPPEPMFAPQRPAAFPAGLPIPPPPDD